MQYYGCTAEIPRYWLRSQLAIWQRACPDWPQVSDCKMRIFLRTMLTFATVVRTRQHFGCARNIGNQTALLRSATIGLLEDQVHYRLLIGPERR